MPRVATLGHPLIDRQHRRLVELSTCLLAATRRGGGLGELGALLRATARHFASEDRLMRLSRYPEIAGHRGLHDGVLRDMRRMQGFLRGGGVAHPAYTQQVVAWLRHHTDAADRNLVAHLRGVAGLRGRASPRASRS